MTAVMPMSWVRTMVITLRIRMSTMPFLPCALPMSLRTRLTTLVLPRAPAMTIMVATRITVVLEKPENAILASRAPAKARMTTQVIPVMP